jgi:hypothetical protein
MIHTKNITINFDAYIGSLYLELKKKGKLYDPHAVVSHIGDIKLAITELQAVAGELGFLIDESRRLTEKERESKVDSINMR